MLFAQSIGAWRRTNLYRVALTETAKQTLLFIVRRKAFWYILKSSGGFKAIQFGICNDIPAAGYFDGDGKTDIAVFRPSTGVWWLLRSTSGLTMTQFGLTNDIHVLSAFVP